MAGMGTRMLPATKAIPKELYQLDCVIIQHVVEEALEAGIEEFIFITRSGKEAIENHFDRNFELEKKKFNLHQTKNFLSSIKDIIPKNIKISSVRQPINLGLGDAILWNT